MFDASTCVINFERRFTDTAFDAFFMFVIVGTFQ